MMEGTHIADGIAVKLLLAGIVLAGGVVGALGFAPVASHSTVDAAVDGATVDDPTRLLFPINNVSAAFPINNVTLSGAAWDVRETDPSREADLGSTAPTGQLFARNDDRDELPQDMDPY